MTESELLKVYLGSYRSAVKRKNALQSRLKVLSAEIENPMKAVTYSVMPKGSSISDGASSIVIRKVELEEKLRDEINTMIETLLGVMSVLDYLPSDSVEREILEYRYIDGMKWESIVSDSGYTRSACFAYQDSGIKQLLGYEKVRLILDKYKEKL